jgi:two-component system, cell cycle response regulator
MTDQLKHSEKLEPVNKIVIAEDDPVSRRVLQAFLVKWGYDVISAVDGLEALRLLESADAPLIAVLDWMMPGLEGPQVCQRVRQIAGRPYTYIILLTAKAQKDDLLAGLEAGADDYLTKPFDAPELRARLLVGQRILDLQSNLISAREELLYRATHDSLTTISNRGVALDAVNREHSRQAREGGSFGVILMDLDHFKYVNDTYGHLCGDAVLRETARRIASCVRTYDTVGRYGGEEFLAVVPSSDATGTLKLAERIRQSIASSPVSTDAGGVPLTLSCGVAVSYPDSNMDPNTILRLADDALYSAKNNGRNRCELADSATSALSSPHAEPAMLPSSFSQR